MNLPADHSRDPFLPGSRRLYFVLASLHVLVIAASNYLVQIPFQIFGFHTTWGALSFPLIFVVTDLTVRIYGKELARRVILSVMFPALVLSYVFSVLFQGGAFQGFGNLSEFNLFVARIAFASFLAYFVGQLLDANVFDRIRGFGPWWFAPAVSTMLANAVDTAMFFSAAFYRSPDPFMAANWVEIALVDYVFKLGFSILFFLPIYKLALNRMTRQIPAAA
ncbi:putative integral membrane protein (TIGR00697 family) [Natronocella acetinitrilica]|uniref:Probable queuosine precursor transporter n=1 Tax=Natronocella acetinitrilica TaxID=414046 RepID=A0AAE3G823_9GAMM|nr:7-cyano-7-deazaguanine/7-aminomethyl-7-deazaguanine transporter [Natronocella acetinitrilica]MCP1675507.1 putative integral membrane protein (TIGR00697 family) [Natronocella acetinitrilica]